MLKSTFIYKILISEKYFITFDQGYKKNSTNYKQTHANNETTKSNISINKFKHI